MVWLNTRNNTCLSKIQYLNKNEFFDFKNNSWLSGFIDAQGCFNVIKIKDEKCSLKYRVRLRFIIDEKNEKWIFYKLKEFLNSGVISTLKQTENMFRFTSTSIKSHEKLVEYLNNFSLRTFKKISFVRFTRLIYYIKNRKTLPWEKQSKVLKTIENLIENIK
jgi:hypothetical protein